LASKDTPASSLETTVNAHAAVSSAVVAAVVTSVALLARNSLPALQATAVVASTTAVAAGTVGSMLVFARARVGGDERLRCVAWGYVVATVLMAVQLTGLPGIASGGGAFSLTPSDLAALYLLWHVAIAAAVLVGLRPDPQRALRVLLTAVTVSGVAVVMGVPARPELIDTNGRFTVVLHGLLAACALLMMVVAAAWERQVGQRATSSEAWITLSLAFSLWDVCLHAFADARFTPLWWASMSMRVLQFGVLAGGLVAGFGALLRALDSHAAALRVRTSELHDAQMSLEHMITSSPVVMFRTDVEYRLTYVSPNVERMLGYVPAEWEGATDWEGLVDAEDLAAVADGLRELPDHGVLDRVVRFRHADGSLRWVEAVIRVEPDDQGRRFLVGCFFDVSRTVELQAGLRQATAEAKGASEAKSRFLSRMSHELRTPLNAILGFSELLELDGVRPDQLESLEQIQKAGRHLLDLINEVLDISRIEGDGVQLVLEPVSVAQVLAESVELMRPFAAARHVEIELRSEDTAGVAVVADGQRLSQVLLNLLSNAAKYNRRGGTIVAKAVSGTSTVRLVVADNGVGIAADKLHRLFQPFDRLGAEETGEEGSGLGLALSKRLVESMGGKLGFTTREGSGSVFWVELPPATSSAAGPAPGSRRGAEVVASSGAASHGTVLYVEDTRSNVELVERAFAHRPGLELIAVAQGERALEIVRHRRPDVILLDLHLPDVHGLEVLRRLRSDLDTASVPVVVITADASTAVRKEAFEAGAHDFLTKPLEIGRLLAVIDGLLRPAPQPIP
jgi:PAS domain S-box-containing protein